MPAMSPISPRPRVKLMPTANEMLGRREGLFSSEVGGVEPVDSPATPELASRFGLVMAQPRPETDDRAARAGFLSRGYDFNQLSDPGQERRDLENEAIDLRNAEVAPGGIMEPARTPTSRESELERSYLQTQVDPEQRRETQRQADVASARAGLLADSALSAQLQREAAKLAWEETYQMPYSEQAARDIAEEVRKNDEDAGLAADLDAMKADMAKEIADLPPADIMDPNSPQTKARKLQEDQIRQRYMMDMNHLLSIRLRRQIELGKEGQSKPVTASDLDDFTKR